MNMSYERFIPHPYQTLLDRRTYVPPLPEPFYQKLLDDYDALTDVTVSRITYQSDGLSITGLTAFPAITPASHPILIYNRGGNRDYGALTAFSAIRSMVPFARKNYLVFASNYRGNDGGEGRDEFGGADVHDVHTLLSLAKQHPGFDGKNIYMLGHSRGGMMTYLAIKQGAALNAAISLAGISDLNAGGRERPEMHDKVYRQLVPPGGVLEDALSERSARNWPEKLTTPLLLLHGDKDPQVDASHSILLAGDMQRLGLTHELKIYPGDNHALLRNWDDVITQSIAWMEAHRQ